MATAVNDVIADNVVILLPRFVGWKTGIALASKNQRKPNSDSREREDAPGQFCMYVDPATPMPRRYDKVRRIPGRWRDTSEPCAELLLSSKAPAPERSNKKSSWSSSLLQSRFQWASAPFEAYLRHSSAKTSNRSTCSLQLKSRARCRPFRDNAAERSGDS